MLEAGVAAAVFMIMVTAARMDDYSTFLWGGMTAALEVAAILFAPFPIIRVIVAGAIAFGTLTAYKLIGKSKQPFV